MTLSVTMWWTEAVSPTNGFETIERNPDDLMNLSTNQSGAAMDTRNNPWLKLSILFLCLTLKIHLSHGGDTISGNETLSGDQTLVSAGGNFALGFFKPGNSSYYYIGMWYKKVSEQTIVWVANRDTPVTDNRSSQLKMLDGNFVLRVTGAVSNETRWQSFDHPTHTWLPGAKLGLDKRTKTPQLLTSWKNTDDPANGLFSLELDPDSTSQYLIRWNRSKQYWSSGTWNGQIFSLVPEMRSNYIYNFSFYSDANQSYFTYSLYDKTIISRFIMDVSGQIKQLTWLDSSRQWNLFWSQPRTQCEVYNFCGPFGVCNDDNTDVFCECLTGFTPSSQNDWNLGDRSAGCKRNTRLQCESNSLSQQKDRFSSKPNMRLPENPQTVNAGSRSACESACFNNCSCTAYAFDSGCSIWIDGLMNLQQLTDGDSSGNTFYLKLAASEFPNSSSDKGKVIGIAVVSAAAVRFAKCHEEFLRKIGGGGFGSVFKGRLPDSSFIAVKKLESISQGEKQFRSEVSTIGTIQHVNLVRLRGFCSEGTKKLLVYDYMPNGSLDAHLFHEKDSEVLDWKKRYQIALGTARGLTYLHEKCRDCIVHCDIKPENILLDAELCPKVADFGLAKLIGRDFSRVLTTMRGTRGYLAPEWISGVAITAKADVYSYGMMLFEFISGRRNSEASEDGKVKFFPTLASSVLTEGDDILILLDRRLERNADPEELTRLCRVACWCIQDEESQRPSMGQVVQILEGVLDVNPPPIPRTLQVFVDNQEQIIFFTESSSSSGQSSKPRSNASTAPSQTKSTVSSSSISEK
ncbi:G-type lectin S-receptor-like serine/threonine-protein kinase [Vitis vinifera]|uniref:Receptor-like serine/threonine-protein kinase n=1 Tax=Vitis vinifera TaxID=29760 RepID=A0A438CSM6_VITVI|nr:G-type lectin S-receptor-like serine/threonine-protein kinase [Vitis vinifera]